MTNTDNTTRVELVYDLDCPNVTAAREQILKAFNTLDLTPRWTEWSHIDPHAPEHVKQYGSPTILVNGKDVSTAVEDQGAACCRIYRDSNGKFSGVPELALVTARLQASAPPGKSPGAVKRFLSVLPALFVVALPKLTCPACWPAYSGLLSAMGLGFINYTAYLLPLTLLFLAVSLIALTYKAPQRRGYMPLLTGIAASGVILVGKFMLNQDWLMYTGIGLLVIASVWNVWPKRHRACPRCT